MRRQPLRHWANRRAVHSSREWRHSAAHTADVARLQAILNSAVAAIITTDEAGMVVDVNPATEKLFGYTEEELIGENIRILHPQDEAGCPDAGKIRAGGRHVMGRRKDGSTFPLHLAIGEFTMDGQRYYTGILRDESDRKEFERNLRAALKAANMVAMRWDCKTNLVSVTSGGESLAAFTRSVTTIDQLLTRIDPVDIESFRREVVASGKSRKAFRMTLRHFTPTGKSQWLELDGQTVADAEGNPLVVHGMLMDVTEKKLAEARRDLLLAEIAHRGKNLLAVVQAIAAVTFQDDRPMGAARAEFAERLSALARSQALLTEHEWSGVSLRELVGLELAAHADRVSINADDLILKPNAAQSMSLVIHELMTNAVKHGALSVPRGQVRIDGRLGWQEHREVLRFTWSELDGPPVQPPTRKGYGSFLIEELLEGIACASRIEFRPEGLFVEASFPAAQLKPGKEEWSNSPVSAVA